MTDIKIIAAQNKATVPLNNKKEDAKTPYVEKETHSSTTKVVLGGLAAAGVIAATLLAIKSGRASNLSVESFKEQGNKFIKGKAIGADGKPFSGTIKQIQKNGKEFKMKYVDGVLQEVKKSVKTIDGSVVKNGEIKTYNYNPSGKIVSVDKKQLNLNNEYFTQNISLKEKKAVGLQRFEERKAREAAEKLKQQQIKQQVKDTEKLAELWPVDAYHTDAAFNNYQGNGHAYSDYRNMIKRFEYLEENEAHLRGEVNNLKKRVRKPFSTSEEILDNRFVNNKEKGLEDLNNYYKNIEAEQAAEAKRLAEKQAKKAEWEKLVRENPDEAAKIRAEKKAAQKAAKAERKAAELKANTRVVENDNGEKVKFVTTKNKDNSKTFKEYSKDGNLVKETHSFADGYVTTAISGDMKTKVSIDRNGNLKTKILGKDKNGKYKLIQSESYDKYGNQKIVEHLDDGNTRITVSHAEQRVVTIRDKKGNILSTKKIDRHKPEPPKSPEAKVLADWYVKYLELCKKYGVQPRICGVSGGAWDHFYELNLRATNPEAYESYLRLQAYRARYDAKAQLMTALHEGKLDPVSLEYAAQNKDYYGAIDTLNEVNRLEQEAKEAARRTVSQRQLVYA